MMDRLKWHLLGWLLFLLFRFQEDFLVEDLEIKMLVLNATYCTTVILTFYFVFSFLCERFSQASNLRFLLIVVPLGVAFFIFCRFVIEEVVLPATVGFDNYYRDELLGYAMDNWWRGYLPVIAATVLFLLKKRTLTSRRNTELLAEKNKAELAFLRAQLNPHFLFNTLSFLHTRALTTAPELAGTILQLSDILRYSVQTSLDKKRILEEEIQLLHSYIDILKKRFGRTCYIEFEWKGENFQQQIEPLLLLPFVENAFKHGVYAKEDKPIRLQLTVEGSTLDFHIENHIKRQHKDQGTGVGLENIRRRLALLYPNRHELHIDKTEDTFSVQLQIEL
ncbi:MAG: histidine kinase [Bacteroidota bacterium]